jgi:predicted  nucleic acid-binding Zn-ribbon protein
VLSQAERRLAANATSFSESFLRVNVSTKGQRLMRTSFIAIMMLLLIFAGCGQSELENKNKELQKQLEAKDQYIEEVTAAINEIHNQLENTWAMENKVLQQSSVREGSKPSSHLQVKEQILSRISDIDSILAANRKKLSDLQARLKNAATQYAGLQKMVDDLKSTLEEREKTLADLQARVKSLESEVTEKTRVIAAREATIENQSNQLNDRARQMNAVYYVVGKKDDLKKQGIVADEGGVLWGLLGSTTVLAGNFNADLFQKTDKTKEAQIDVPGKIAEIIPKRDAESYSTEETPAGRTILKIVKADQFWKVNRVVIVSK